jgi:hypothetical protein
LASQLSTSAANDRKHPHRPIDPFLPNINILPIINILSIINIVVMIKVMLGDFFSFGASTSEKVPINDGGHPH